MKFYLQRIIFLFLLFAASFITRAQTTNTYTSSTTWIVPAGVSTITIKVYGGAGGTGGQDCGAGCTNAAAGPVGYVVADYTVTAGDVVGIYPGGNGVNGSNNVTGAGGGNGGIATYSTSYNGGNGGNAGSSGSSGGGGGGGAASVITINSIIKIVAGGAGGGGGMANQANSGQPGNSTTSSNGTSNTGGFGTTPSGDGGGGGGGGGGQYGSVGGGVHPAGAENAGDGGYLGGNSVIGASSVTTNGNIAWTSTGQIEITYTSTLPVTWLSFTASRINSSIILKWSTATEQNTKDYKVQSSLNGSDWSDIGTVSAAGNSITTQQYSFVDQNPLSGLNYFRLLQYDLDGKINYSKVIAFNFETARDLLKIYPNPVYNGTVTVNIKQPSRLELYNSIGVKIMEKEFTSGEHSINVSALARGTYFMKSKDAVVSFVIQ
jgi:hypothetical protein